MAQATAAEPAAVIGRITILEPIRQDEVDDLVFGRAVKIAGHRGRRGLRKGGGGEKRGGEQKRLHERSFRERLPCVTRQALRARRSVGRSAGSSELEGSAHKVAATIFLEFGDAELVPSLLGHERLVGQVLTLEVDRQALESPGGEVVADLGVDDQLVARPAKSRLAPKPTSSPRKLER
jgi:hypothetical protein